MITLRFNKRRVPHLIKLCSYSSVAKNEDEYTTTPQYPEILDLSYEKRIERKKEVVHEELRNVKTVEEKQIKLNMPRYYGFKTYLLKEDYIPYNNLKLTQHVTRTHLIRTEKLPEFYDGIQVNTTEMKTEIEDNLLFELDGYKRPHELTGEDLDKVQLDNLISFSISRSINRTILNELLNQYPHLKNVQIDFEPRIESSWYAGGMVPPLNVKRYRDGREWQKHMINEPTNRAMTYLGTALLALRSENPLKPVMSLSECENPALEVPFWKWDPRTVGTTTEHRHIANVPGFWPGDPHEFGLLSFHRRGHMLTRHYNDTNDDQEALCRQGILASFGWLNAQANFLGFNSFNDLTYPLVTQTTITNGQFWSFYCYQLNTIKCHDKYIYENPKRNICWATPEMKLFEKVENGKFVGFNEDVLNVLLKFYSNVPDTRLGINLKPFISKEEKLIADYQDEDKRKWLEKEYKFLVANRSRHRLEYEIYHWEKIYKIDNETRIMEARRRPFELGKKPFNRTLDDRQAEYIPRVLRPHLPKQKGRYAKMYFP